jgi:hypothetical protein
MGVRGGPEVPPVGTADEEAHMNMLL